MCIRCCDIYRSPVIQDANRIIVTVNNFTYDATASDVGVCYKFQFFTGVDIGLGNVLIRVRVVRITHLEALIAIQRNSVSCVHGSQSENIILLHVLDVHIFGSSGLCQIPGQGNGQRLVRSSNTCPFVAVNTYFFFTADEKQVFACYIGLIVIISLQVIVNSLCRIQTHVTLCVVICGVNGSHVDGRMLTCLIGTACYGDISARLHVESATRLDAQGQIAFNREGL